MKKTVTIRSNGHRAEVLPSTVTTWVRHGWTVVDDERDEAESGRADEADQSGPADPDDSDEE